MQSKEIIQFVIEMYWNGNGFESKKQMILKSQLQCLYFLKNQSSLQEIRNLKFYCECSNQKLRAQFLTTMKQLRSILKDKGSKKQNRKEQKSHNQPKQMGSSEDINYILNMLGKIHKSEEHKYFSKLEIYPISRDILIWLNRNQLRYNMMLETLRTYQHTNSKQLNKLFQKKLQFFLSQQAIDIMQFCQQSKPSLAMKIKDKIKSDSWQKNVKNINLTVQKMEKAQNLQNLTKIFYEYKQKGSQYELYESIVRRAKRYIKLQLVLDSLVRLIQNKVQEDEYNNFVQQIEQDGQFGVNTRYNLKLITQMIVDFKSQAALLSKYNLQQNPKTISSILNLMQQINKTIQRQIQNIDNKQKCIQTNPFLLMGNINKLLSRMDQKQQTNKNRQNQIQQLKAILVEKQNKINNMKEDLQIMQKQIGNIKQIYKIKQQQIISKIQHIQRDIIDKDQIIESMESNNILLISKIQNIQRDIIDKDQIIESNSILYMCQINKISKQLSQTKLQKQQIMRYQQKLYKQNIVHQELKMEIKNSGILVGDILVNGKYKKGLISWIQNYSQKNIISSRFIYRYEKFNLIDPHILIDGLANWVVLIQLSSGIIIGAYCMDPLSLMQQKTSNGIMFNLNSQKMYQLRTKNKTQRVYKYDQFYLEIGNSEIRYSFKDNTVRTSFGSNFRFFQTKKDTVTDFFGEDNEVMVVKNMEFHQVFFS